MHRILTLSLVLLTASTAFADNLDERETRIQTNLRVNRKLLSQYAWEIGRLRRAQRHVFTQSVQDRLNGLRYKVQALKSDRERLKSRQPMTAQADEFLSSFIVRHGEMVIPKPRVIATPASQTKRLHEEALALVAERKLKEAAQKYEEIALVAPDNDEAYLLMGHVYVMLGHYDRAEYAYYNAVHIDKANYDEIIPFYQNMILNSPEDDEAYRLLGYAYLILGDAARAKDAYQEATRINPANIEAQKGLALLHQRFGI